MYVRSQYNDQIAYQTARCFLLRFEIKNNKATPDEIECNGDHTLRLSIKILYFQYTDTVAKFCYY